MQAKIRRKIFDDNSQHSWELNCPRCDYISQKSRRDILLLPETRNYAFPLSRGVKYNTGEKRGKVNKISRVSVRDKSREIRADLFPLTNWTGILLITFRLGNYRPSLRSTRQQQNPNSFASSIDQGFAWSTKTLIHPNPRIHSNRLERGSLAVTTSRPWKFFYSVISRRFLISHLSVSPRSLRAR